MSCLPIPSLSTSSTPCTGHRLSSEYHGREHTTTGKSPREHWLAEVEHLRVVRQDLDLDEVFLHRATRRVRKDGTVRFDGQRLEVRAELVGKWVELRYAPSQRPARPRVFLDGRFVCDTVEMNLYKNATRTRRRDLGQPDPQATPTGLDPLQQIHKQHYERTRPPRRMLPPKKNQKQHKGD